MVGDRRAKNAQRIETKMIIETAILGGEYGIHHMRWHLVERNVIASQPLFGDDLAVCGQYCELGGVLAQSRLERIRGDQGVDGHHPNQNQSKPNRAHKPPIKSESRGAILPGPLFTWRALPGPGFPWVFFGFGKTRIVTVLRSDEVWQIRLFAFGEPITQSVGSRISRA